MPLATLSIDLEAKLASLEEGMGKAARLTEKAAAQIDSNFARVRASSVLLNGVLQGIGAGLTFGALSGAFKSIVGGVDRLNDLKDATGASIENLSGLEDVALRTGNSFESVSSALIKLNKELTAAEPGSATANIFKQIGLDAEALKKIDPAEALRLTAVALAGFADDGNKARVVQALFGKSIAEVAPLLNDLAKAGKLVATVTTEQAERAEKFNQQLDVLQKNSLDAGRSLSEKLLPALNSILEAYIKLGGFKGIGASVLGVDDIGKAEAKAKSLNADVTLAADRLQSLAEESRRDPGNEFLATRVSKARERLNALRADAAAASEAIKGFANKLSPLDPAFRASQNYGDGIQKKLGNVAGKTDTSAADQAQKQLDKLLEGLNKRLAVDRRQLELGRELNDAEKAQIDIAEKLANISGGSEKTRKEIAEKSALQVLEADRFRLQQLGLKLATDETVRRFAEAQAIDAENVSLAENIKLMNDQLAALDSTAKQREATRRAREDAAIDVGKGNIAQQRALGADPATLLALSDQVKLLERTRDVRRAIFDRQEVIANDPLTGAQKGLEDYLDSIAKAGEASRRAIGDALKSLEDGLTDALTGKKVDAKAIVDSLIAEFTRLTVVKPLLQSIFGGFSLNSPTSGSGLLSTAFKFLASANGNAFGPAGQITAFADGGVFDRATPFLYGAGSLGQLGEAGPEAVMPLRRGRGGKLGVVAQGGERSATTVYHIDARGADAGVEARIQRAMKAAVQQSVATVQAKANRGGSFAKAVGRR